LLVELRFDLLADLIATNFGPREAYEEDDADQYGRHGYAEGSPQWLGEGTTTRRVGHEYGPGPEGR
jgi:hypothetical protein